MKKKYITNSEKETYNLAEQFASTLSGHETVCMVGDLGSGKTAFTKGLASGLGVEKIITSPTFVLMKNYQGNKFSLAHIDAYRLSNSDELEAIGVDDNIKNKKCITVIEWADRVRDIWPSDCIEINFKTLKGDEREINIKK